MISPAPEKTATSRLLILFLMCGLLVGTVRFHRLGDSVLRADELNRYLEGRSAMTLVEFWRSWEPTNQIPFQNVLCMGVARLFPEVNEFSLRFIGALIGTITVLLMVGWLYRHSGWLAALVGAAWISLHPYHLHESREAYYYGLLMFTSTLFSLISLAWMQRMRQTSRVPGWGIVAGWLVSAYLLCLTHMSAWVYAAVWAAGLMVSGLIHLPAAQRKRMTAILIACGMLLLVLMRRWIRDAIGEIRKVTEVQDFGFIGDRFVDVAPRVLPMYMGGVNWVGWGLLILAVTSAVVVWRNEKGKGTDALYRDLSVMTLLSVVALTLYIGGVGGGVAKETFFTSFWGVLTLWAVLGIVKAANWIFPGNARLAVYVLSLLLLAVFARPAWALVNMDGKVTPYRQIAQALDANVPPGSVVIVDRWFEPWVEMAIYPPELVTVSFTKPDEPYRAFWDGDWRAATRRAFEDGRADAFLRLARNHEQITGVWDWPEQYFARSVAITNQEALWLRQSGFSVMSGIHDANTNRTVVHLFYNTPEDLVAKAKAAHRPVTFRFGTGWTYLKPWRFDQAWRDTLAANPGFLNAGPDFQRRAGELLQMLWIQAGAFMNRGTGFASTGAMTQLAQHEAQSYFKDGQWMDYRVASGSSVFHLYNVTDEPVDADLEIIAISLAGSIRASVSGQPVELPGGLMVKRTIPVRLVPGENAIPVVAADRQLVLVMNARVRVE